MRRLYIVLFTVLFAIAANAQLTGTKNIPGDYPSLDLAITDLNTVGVGAGGVTLNLVAGNPQTAPAGGYSITASGTLANPITIQGNNNTITASGSLTVGSLNDAIFKLIGADYVTITGFNMQENAANTVTAAATNNMTEWGIALLYASTTNGAQNNTILNNTIALNKTYSNSCGIYSNVRHSAIDVVTLADITNSTTGPNSNNKVYGNNISNVSMGIVFIGSATAANMDVSNDIGGASAVTGNSITNYGGLGSATAFVGLPSAVLGAYINDENNFNLSFNSFISASLNTAAALRGILTDYSAVPIGSITNNINSNTVTFTQAGAGGLQGITTAATAGAMSNVTTNMNSNNFINNAVTGAASAVTMFGIANLGAFGTLNMNSNVVRSNTSTATTGGISAILNQGAVINAININNNQLGNASGDAITFSSATTGLCNMVTNALGAAGCTLNINGNSFKGLTCVSDGQTIAIFNTSGFLGGNVTITNNNIGTAAGNFVTFSGANSSLVRAIESDGGSSATVLNISNNDFRGFVHSVTGSSAYTFIFSSFAVLSRSYNNNTFTNLSLNTTGSVTFFTDGTSLTATGTENMSGNSIVTGFAKPGTGGTITIRNTNAGSATGSNVVWNNNNFSNISLTGAAAFSGFINTDGGAPTKTITNNTINNLTVSGGTSGAITGVSVSFIGGTTSSVSNNTVTNVTGQGAITGITVGTSGSATTLNVSGNTATNLVSNGTGGAVTGLACGNPSTTTNVTNNIINTLSSTGASSTILGLSITGGTTANVNNNTVNTLSGSGATSPLVRGISVSSGTTLNVFKNKVYDLSESGAITTTAGAVNGLIISAGTTVTAYNNLIGDLRAPAASLTDAIRGINITSATSSSNVRIYFNTVNLNASSTGANFGTTGIFHTTSATATTAALDMRNNIIVNTSTPAGTGLTVVYRRSSATLTNFAATSNRNLYYGGTPGAANLIFNDGTNSDQTLAAYKVRVAPIDANSVTENPPFLSTTGSAPNFLHINSAIATQAQGLGLPIAGITDDYDGDIRNTSTPDIGADEFTTCTGAAGGTAIVTGPSSFCASGTPVITASGYSAGVGSGYQWMTSTIIANYPASGTPVAGQTNPATLTTGVVSVTTYYWLKVTCPTGTATAYSNMLTITVNPSVASITPSSPAPICQGQNVTLTENGGTATSWSWSPGGAVTQAINVSPATTTTYTVTANSPGGCVATANVTVTVNPVPTGVTASASSNSVCSGTPVNLFSNATVPPGTIISQDFESGLGGWTTFNNTTGGTPANTAWTLRPHGYVSTNSTPVTFNSPGGTQFLLSNADLGGSGTTVFTILQSPVFSTVGYTALNLSFRHFYQFLSATETFVEVSTNGTTWTNLKSYTATQGTSTGFVTDNINMSAYVGQSTVYIRFRYQDGWSWFWALDDIAVTGTPASFGYSWTSSPAGFTSSVQNPTGVAPTTTTTYTVTVSGIGGCTATANTTVTVTSPVVSGSMVQPTTCVSADGSITLSVSGGTGGVGPYSYAWTGSGVNPTSQNQTNLQVGNYNVTVTDVPSGCSTVASFALTGPGGCNVCPTIPSLTTNPTPAGCIGSNVTLTAPGLINMGITYGITFKYSLVALADPYAGGTVIATVPNGSLGSSGTSATTNTSFGASGNYFIYAILSPAPVNPACRPSALVNFTVNPIPTVNGVPDQILCNTAATTAVSFSGSLPGTVFNWTNNTPSIGLAANGSGNIPSFIATNGAASPVTATIVVTPSYTNAGGTCFGTPTTFFITVKPSPTVTINGGGVSVCPGATVNLTTTATPGVTYSWQKSFTTGIPGTPVGTNTSSLSVTQSGVYIVTVLAGTGCTGSASTTVNVADYIFNGSIANTDATQTDRLTLNGVVSTCAAPKVCPGNTVAGTIHYDTYTITNPRTTAVCATVGLVSGCGNNVFSAAYLGSYDPTNLCNNYLGDAGFSATGTYYEVNIPANGTVVIVVNEITSGVGCSNYTLSVDVPRAAAAITVTPGTTICNGSPATLTASAANTYLWSPGGATTQSIIVSPAATTSYSVTLGYGNHSCTASASQTITVSQPPSLSTPSNVVICSGLNTSYSVTASGAGPFTYQWQINQGSGYINLNNVSPFSNTTAATLNITGVTTAYNGNLFRVVVTGACGVTTSNAATLTVNQTPTVTVAPSGNCAPVTLTAQGTSNTYSWSPATGLNTTTGAIVIATPAATTTYTVTGTVTATGCQNTATATVLGNSSASVLSGTATICAGVTTNLVVNITGGISPYTVVYSNGTSNITVNGYVSGTNIPVSPSSTTTYTLVSVTGANGCAGIGNSGTAVITVNAVPAITVGPNNQCGPVTLTATGAFNTFSWSPTAGLSPTTGATVVANPTVTTLYTVTGTVTATGCQNSATVNVFATPPAPVVSPSSIGICVGAITQLTATATPAAVWSPATGLYTDVSATVAYVAGTQVNTVYAKPAVTTTYSVTSTLGSCTSVATSVTVTVYQPLVITTQPANLTVCQGGTATFSVAITGNQQSYQWQVSTNGGGTFTNIAGATNASLVLTGVATTLNNNQYRVVITNSCNTVTSTAAVLTVNPLPATAVTALQNRICLSDTSVSLAGVGTPSGGSWSGPGISGFNFVPVATGSGTYTLTYTYSTALGCTASASTVVTVQDCQERLRLLRDNAVILYPNPNTGRFNIRINSTLYSYLGMKVFTSTGEVVRTQIFSGLVYGRVIAIDMTSLPPDVYMVKFYYDDGNRTSNKTFKVIIGSH